MLKVYIPSLQQLEEMPMTERKPEHPAVKIAGVICTFIVGEFKDAEGRKMRDWI